MIKKQINWAKRHEYNVQTGLHPCVVVGMYDTKGKDTCSNPSKILLAPLGQTDPLKISVVAREYCNDVPNESLREDLDTILEGRLEEHVDADGAFDYRSVEGREVVAVVQCYQGKNHENPYSFVTDILPKDALKAS
jgi:hypothetical protein